MRSGWSRLAAGLLGAVAFVGLAAAQTPKKMPLGVLVQLTGVSGEFGVQVQHAVNIAKEELKAEGKVELDIFYEDHQIQPQLALAGFEKLVDTRKTPVIISNGSSVLLAIGPLANERKTLVMNIAGVTPKLRSLAPYVVNIIPTADVDGRELAAYIAKELGIKEIAGIHVNAEYGFDSMATFKQSFEAAGGKVVATEIHATGVVDMRTQLLKIKAVNPPALVIFSNEGENAHVVAQAREVGLRAELFGTNFMLRDIHYKIAGEAMNGLKGVTFRFDPEGTPQARSFVEKYRKAYGRAPDLSSVLAFDAVKLLAEAIDKVGPDATRIRAYVVGVKDWPGTIGKINFDDSGTVKLDFARYEIKDMKPVYTMPK